MSLVKNPYVYGKYKIHAFKDEDTNDYNVDENNEYLKLEESEDLYLKCSRPKNGMISYYGKDIFKGSKKELLSAFVPSNTIAKEVEKALKGSIVFYIEGDGEHTFFFYDEDLDKLKTVLKIGTKGSLVMPYKDGVKRRKTRAKKTTEKGTK